ncbi:DUF1761 domain-containing protein [Novosphingopyxis sp.]|uniref:DUF1761 domain-containing protein n=1 Tax=Novosphingopyxis sp. TaxID=2709690 RepID=UPI003B58F3FD
MNILTILLAALAAFLVGGLWYGPLFGTAWMRLIGKTPEELGQANMVKLYGIAFLFALLQATMLAHLFARIGAPPFHIVMMISTGIALGFVIPAIGTNYLFRREPGKLFFIDAGYWFAFYAAMGLVFALLG